MHPHNKRPPRRSYHLKRQKGGSLDADSHRMFHRVIVKVNVIRPICRSMFGKNHSAMHRICVGLVVAATGVVLAKWLGHSHNEYVSHFGDFGGYALHGLGLTPLVEKISEVFGGALE